MKRIREVIGRTNNALTRAKILLESRLGILDDLVIEPFTSWGTPDALHVHGRVIESKKIRQPRSDDSLLTGVVNSLRRLESDEIPGAVLTLTSGSETIRAEADEEGFFRVDVETGAPFAPGWHRVPLELVESIAGETHASAVADVVVPDPRSQYVVVSDLDDTVVVTGATDKLQMIRLVVTKNARERRTFPGVAALYRALHAGRGGYPENPIVYVTRSGWNLYDLFEQILEEQKFPKGPLLMQDFANVEPPADSFEGLETKFAWYERLFSELPHQFVLIGDSGQTDAEDYLRCVERWPGRVAAVFIRDVTSPERDREVREIVRTIASHGVATALSDSALEMARDAARIGLIEKEAIASVRRAMERSEQP